MHLGHLCFQVPCDLLALLEGALPHDWVIGRSLEELHCEGGFVVPGGQTAANRPRHGSSLASSAPSRRSVVTL
ncbi:hypothetical protein BDR22DRAFT_848880 [Usnea florida]